MPPSSKISRLAEFDKEYTGGRSYVLGIDEAGRGALAGPVCAGAVAVRTDAYLSGVLVSPLSALNDSKRGLRVLRK